MSNLSIINAGSNGANEHFAIYARGVPNVLSNGTWTLSGLAVEGGNQAGAATGGGLWCFSDFVSPASLTTRATSSCRTAPSPTPTATSC